MLPCETSPKQEVLHIETVQELIATTIAQLLLLPLKHGAVLKDE